MRPTTENQCNLLGRTTIPHNHVEDLESFHRNIVDRFSHLLPPSSSLVKPSVDSSDATSPLMSIAWLQKLLDTFLCCDADFKATLLITPDPSHILKPPLDRFIPDLLERSVKALDICNAISHGVDAIRFVQKQAEVAVAALDQRPFTDGQVRRAKKALESALNSAVIAEKEASTKDRHVSNFRSLSWGISKNWSAAKQIQAISSNLCMPRGAESTGLPMTFYTMSVVLAFVMWALVAAIPCQQRAGLGAHVPVPKQLGWAHSMCGLQERIAEEWKRKEKRGGSSAGLMEEVVRLEKVVHSIADSLSQLRFPILKRREAEVADDVAELAEICGRVEEGLVPLQMQMREVFHRIVGSRAEVLDMLDQARKGPTFSV